MTWLTLPDLGQRLEIETGVALSGVVLALVIGMIATLVLFLSVKRETRRLVLRERRRTDRQVDALSQRLDSLRAVSEEAHSDPATTEPTPILLSPASDRASPPVADTMVEEVGLATRARALKRIRAGEPLETIVREVSAPLCEIQLLARVEEHLTKARAKSAAKNNDPVAQLSDQSQAADSPKSPPDASHPAATPAQPRARSATAGAPNE